MTDGVPPVNLSAQHPAGSPLRRELLQAVERVLDHGHFILGPEVQELERRLAQYVGAAHVVAVGSGTAALVLALRDCGIGPGDEVITVSHTFVATAHAIRLVGAEPVFVDIEDESMLMDPQQLEAVRGPRCRAVMPVHLNGAPVQLAAIKSFCQRHGLELIEDCAQALGAQSGGIAVGQTGLCAFSLHPLKILGAMGDAGFIACETSGQASRLSRARNLGLLDRDHCGEVGDNARLDTLQAALLLCKLEYLESWQSARLAHAEAYRAALGSVLRFPSYGDEVQPVVSCLATRHPRRDDIQQHCAQRGVIVKAHYPIAVHQQRPYAACRRGRLPVTERVVSELLSLPCYPELTEPQRERVISAILEVA